MNVGGRKKLYWLTIWQTNKDKINKPANIGDTGASSDTATQQINWTQVKLEVLFLIKASENIFVVTHKQSSFGASSKSFCVSNQFNQIVRVNARRIHLSRRIMENSTLDCQEGVPSVAEFFAGFQHSRELLLIVPIAFCLTTLALYVINLRGTVRNENRETKGNVAALLTIYPVSWIVNDA